MNTSTINKQELIDWINQLEDQAVLVTLQSIKNSVQGTDFWNDLPGELKESINQAKKEADEGKGIPHQEAMKQIREQFLR